MSLDSASPLEKGLDPKPFVIKTGSVCELSCVNETPKTVSLTNSLAQLSRVILRPRRTGKFWFRFFKSGEKGKK